MTIRQNDPASGWLGSLFTGFTALYIMLMLLYLLARFALPAGTWWIDFLHNLAWYYFLPVILLLPLALLLRRRLLSLWLVIIAVAGLLWAGPALLPPLSTPDASGYTARFITMNVKPYNEELPDVAQWLAGSNADIIALQEVTPQGQQELIALLSPVYPNHQSTIEDDRGPMIFSRFPVTDGELLPDMGEGERMRALVEVNGQSLAVYSVHLDMPANNVQRDLPLPSPLAQYDESQRNEQIRDLIQRARAETIPVIMAGDFNTAETSPIYGTLDAVLVDAYRQSSWGTGATWPAGQFEGIPPWVPRIVRLDYIWTSNDIRPMRALLGPRIGSDHLPVIAQLQLPAR